MGTPEVPPGLGAQTKLRSERRMPRREGIPAEARPGGSGQYPKRMAPRLSAKEALLRELNSLFVKRSFLNSQPQRHVPSLEMVLQKRKAPLPDEVQELVGGLL